MIKMLGKWWQVGSVLSGLGIGGCISLVLLMLLSAGCFTVRGNQKQFVELSTKWAVGQEVQVQDPKQWASSTYEWEKFVGFANWFGEQAALANENPGFDDESSDAADGEAASDDVQPDVP